MSHHSKPIEVANLQAQTYSSLYEQIELIHKQSSMSIYLVSTKRFPKQFFIAKKTLIFSLDEQSQNQIFNECKVLKTLDHPHIIKYNNIYLENQEMVVVLEYCEEGDLAHYLRKRIERKDYLSEKLIMNWLLQILIALDYIHSNKIIHRGLELSNIFLTGKGNIKLGSFGHSKVLESTNAMASTSVGRLGYMSPEMFQSKPYDVKSDMWALGCIIYELATFTPLFDDRLPVTSLYDRIVCQPPPDLPPAYMKTLFKIYRKLLKKNPSARPAARELLKIQLFLSLMEQYLNKKRIDALDLNYIPLKKLAIHEKLSESRKRQKERGCILPPLCKFSQSSSSKQVQTRDFSHLEYSSLHERSVESQSNQSIALSGSRSSTRTNSKSKEVSNSGVFKKNQKRKSSHECQNLEVKDKVEFSSYHLPAIDSRSSPRLTKKNEEQEDSNIERLYRVQINLMCKQLELKYGPKMDQILERTLQYDPEDS